MTRCLAPECLLGGLGCDNMSVVLVCFLIGEPYEKLADKCKLNPLPINQPNSQNTNKAVYNSNNINFNLSSINSTNMSSGIELK